MTLEGERASVVTGDQNVAEDLLVMLGLQESSRSLELLAESGCDEPFEYQCVTGTLNSPTNSVRNSRPSARHVDAGNQAGPFTHKRELGVQQW